MNINQQHASNHLDREWWAGIRFGVIVTLCLQLSGCVLLWGLAGIWRLAVG